MAEYTRGSWEVVCDKFAPKIKKHFKRIPTPKELKAWYKEQGEFVSNNGINKMIKYLENNN